MQVNPSRVSCKYLCFRENPNLVRACFISPEMVKEKVHSVVFCHLKISCLMPGCHHILQRLLKKIKGYFGTFKSTRVKTACDLYIFNEGGKFRPTYFSCRVQNQVYLNGACSDFFTGSCHG